MLAKIEKISDETGLSINKLVIKIVKEYLEKLENNVEEPCAPYFARDVMEDPDCQAYIQAMLERLVEKRLGPMKEE